ncbi:MAG: hypothetical protein ABFR95_07895 [Actinomycetota bacterium]
MDTQTRIAAATLAIALAISSASPLLPGPPSPETSIQEVAADGSATGESPWFLFHGATEAQAEKMSWAVHRFHELDLELPRLDIYFRDDCRDRFGAWGRIQYDSGIPWRVEVCTTAVYLHELAHAWDHWNLSDAERRTYLELRGLEAWQGDDVPWDRRGIEDLAILVARVVGQGIHNYHSEDRSADLHAFEQITGIEVPTAETPDATDPRFGSPQY